MISKKGDLPVIILVIGVFFVFGLAIFSFYDSSKNFENDFKSVLLIQRLNSLEKMNTFYNQVDSAENIHPRNGEPLKEGNFIFTFEKSEENCYLSGNYTLDSGFLRWKKHEQKTFILRKVECWS